MLEVFGYTHVEAERGTNKNSSIDQMPYASISVITIPIKLS